jgi:predicted glycosyl hydrolase (DUF1957 family)
VDACTTCATRSRTTVVCDDGIATVDITLGLTPVVAAQLDDPYCLDGMHRWLANWQLRAREATTLHTPTGAAAGSAMTSEALRRFGIREYDEATRSLEDFTTEWRHGAARSTLALHRCSAGDDRKRCQYTDPSSD